MANIIVSVIILAIVITAVAKIVIEKRKGAKCIGCPYSEGDSGCSCDNLE
ncbi:MAG: FeoB-associated Cys-rich membrane protein [Halothermotrichaceae bacterium]